jgi:2-polyprenyl-3-methyl-5-hydroxy-6-metoxy-1,4-benzoquinol methylase
VSRTNKQERITEFWGSIGPYYNQDPENVVAPDTIEYAAWVEAVSALLPSEPSDVLDVGTGTGFLAFIVASLGHRVTGIDLSLRTRGRPPIHGR